jgi:hypothetical protein
MTHEAVVVLMGVRYYQARDCPREVVPCIQPLNYWQNSEVWLRAPSLCFLRVRKGCAEVEDEFLSGAVSSMQVPPISLEPR